MTRLKYVAVLLMTAPAVSASAQSATPPLTKQVVHTDTILGELRTDNYAWLQDRNDPAVLAHIAAENQYADELLAHTLPLQDSVYRELQLRASHNELSVPERSGGYVYYSRQPEGQQYRIFARRRAVAGAPEEVLLDVNLLANGKKHFGMRQRSISPDQRLLAYAVDTLGNERYTIYIKDLKTGNLLSESIPETSGVMEWSSDGRALFYPRPGVGTFTAMAIYRHDLGESVAVDPLMFHATDSDAYGLVLTKTADARFFLVYRGNVNGGQEVLYWSTDRPMESVRILAPLKAEVRYSVEHNGRDFLVVRHAPNSADSVFRVADANPSRAWQSAFALPVGAIVETVLSFRDHVVTTGRFRGQPAIWVTEFPSQKTRRLSMPESAYSIEVSPTSNRDYGSRFFRYRYSSFTTPTTVVDYDMVSRKQIVRDRAAISGYDAASYRSERIWAKACDGTRIPISLVYKKPFRANNTRPAVLYGYGASLWISSDPKFDPTILPLLDRGVVYAIANVRGGAELGPRWHAAGTGLNRKTSITDFIASAEYLVRRGYAAPNRIVIKGESSGGALVAQAANMRPDLFRAVVAAVPFVDAVTRSLEAESRSAIDTHQKYDAMKSWSPYENVRAQRYPTMLFLPNLNDPRVMYWESAKLVAKIRAAQTGGGPVLVLTGMSGGHGSASGQDAVLRASTIQAAFILDALSVIPSVR
jgi:oligopeptidase B